MTNDRPKLRMVGRDGNAFAILGRAHRAAPQAGMPEEQWKAIQAEATAGDYNNLLATMMKYFDCDGEEEDHSDKFVWGPGDLRIVKKETK
jgi:hypothetical protein